MASPLVGSRIGVWGLSWARDVVSLGPWLAAETSALAEEASALTRRVADEPILLARCRSLQKKRHYNTWRLRSPLLAATSSLVELTFKQLTRKVESLYSFRRSKCQAAQKSLIVWALVRDFVPYLPGAKHEGRSPAQLAGVDLQGLPWLQYVNLKLSEVT